jgi:putative inorganic carbon (hco3(-)) transporter
VSAREPGARALAVARVALVALAFALPLSIALTEGALVLGLLALAAARIAGRPWTFARSWLEPALLAVAGSWLLASAFSVAPLASLFNVRKLYAFGLIYLAAEAAREPAMRRRVVAGLLAGGALSAAAGYTIFAFRALVRPGYRLESVLSNSMTSGGVLCAVALWALGAAAAGGRRVTGARLGALATLLFLLPALALTQTRSSWLGFGAGAAVVLVALAPRAWWTLPAGLGVAALVAPHALAARFGSIFDPHEPGNQGRLSMWRSGLDILRDHPWVGVGCQDLLALYRRYRRPDWTFESGHFHNNFVQVAVMAGIVGLAAFLFWHAAAARQLWRARRAAVGEDRGVAAAGLAVFVALVVSGMFDFTFGDQEVVYHTYLALGLALAILPARSRITTEVRPAAP